MERQIIAERTARFHSEQALKRHQVESRKQAAESAPRDDVPTEEDPAYDKERAIVQRIMLRSHDDLYSKYPVVGEPFQSVASLKAAQEHSKPVPARRRLSQGSIASSHGTDATIPELTATTVEGLRRIGSSTTGFASFRQTQDPEQEEY